MKIKTTAAICAAIMLAALLCGCSADPSKLTKKGLELAANMDALASLEQYSGSMTSSTGVAGLVGKMAAGDYSSPKAIYAVSLDDEAALDIIMEGNTDMAAPLKAWMLGRIYASIPTQLSGFFGAETLAAVSVAAYDECFVFSGLDSPTLYLYQYEGDYSVMVSFRPGEDDAVRAAAQFVPNDDTLMAAGTAEDIAAWLTERLAFPGITVSSVALPRN